MKKILYIVVAIIAIILFFKLISGIIKFLLIAVVIGGVIYLFVKDKKGTSY